MFVYEWAEGSHPFHKADPVVVAEELDRIEEKHGSVTAQIVVEEAASRRSPLHKLIYHVDQETAAVRHYEQRAGALIRALRVKVISSEPSPSVRTRIFLEPEGREPSYFRSEEIVDDSELYLMHRNIVKRKMVGLRRELLAFEEFRAVVQAIETAVAA